MFLVYGLMKRYRKNTHASIIRNLEIGPNGINQWQWCYKLAR